MHCFLNKTKNRRFHVNKVSLKVSLLKHFKESEAKCRVACHCRANGEAPLHFVASFIILSGNLACR